MTLLSSFTDVFTTLLHIMKNFTEFGVGCLIHLTDVFILFMKSNSLINSILYVFPSELRPILLSFVVLSFAILCFNIFSKIVNFIK